MAEQAETLRRTPLSRDRILRAAVALADDAGIESLSMRNLAQDLGVVPMALYKHVANKDELLDGMIDVVVGEIDPPAPDADWKRAVRQRILSARRVLLRHPWASLAIESRNTATPAVLAYLDSMIGAFRAGGFSVDLDPPRDARDGQPNSGLQPGAVRRLPARRSIGRPTRPDRRQPATGDRGQVPACRGDRHGGVARRRIGRRGRAATTSSSSSSRWTCCWTASNACTSAAGHRHVAETAAANLPRRCRRGRFNRSRAGSAVQLGEHGRGHALLTPGVRVERGGRVLGTSPSTHRVPLLLHVSRPIDGV